MTKFFFLPLIGILLLWSSCSCPPSEKVGELSLTSKAQAFLPYDGSETLNFEDETGALLSLIATEGRQIQNNELCTQVTCTEAKFGSPSSCDFYAAESNRYTFSDTNEQVVIDLLVYTEIYERTVPNFFDALQVALSIGTPSTVGHHLIEGRFNESIDLTKINLTDFFTEAENLDLNGQTFTNILSYEEGDLALYLKEGVGVVGFKNEEHSWVVQL